MSRSRKRRSQGKASGQAPNNRRQRAGRPHRSGAARPAPENFWGDPAALPARHDVRIAEDPTATVRSLGPPPLPGHEDIAEHYFAVVYDRAVQLAGALAAVGGLIAAEELAARDDAAG